MNMSLYDLRSKSTEQKYHVHWAVMNRSQILMVAIGDHFLNGETALMQHNNDLEGIRENEDTRNLRRLPTLPFYITNG